MLAANSNPLVRGFDASLDGAADDAAATRYTVITGERICGWSCDPSSPHYEKDHHMCPAHCGGGEARRRWREDFYDHFLDGAAGVMYTSFLGLILDDLIALGTGKYKKC